MSQEILDRKCPGCGAPVTINTNECKYCGREIEITTFNSVYSMPAPMVNRYVGYYKNELQAEPEDKGVNKAIGICFLKLKLYSKAIEAFDKAIIDNFDDSESYFYLAVCILSGKKAFLNPRTNIDKALEYINAAIMIEPRGIYHYFMAYIKYDFFARKSYITSPDYMECLNNAMNSGVSNTDIQMMYEMMGVQRPECL